MRFGKGASGSVMRQPTHEINNEDDYARRLELDFEQFEEDIALPEEVINKYTIMYYQPLDREDEFMKKYWKDVIIEKKKREKEETNAYKEEIQQAEEVEKSGRGIKKNAWIEHCKKYQKKHNCSWKEAMIGAKATYKKGGNIKFPNGLTKEQMEAYKAKGQYVSNGRWMQLQNGKYTWWTSKTGSGSQMSSFTQTYNPVESILNFITYITEETNHIIRQQDLEHYSDEELYNLYENLLNGQLPNIVSSEVDWDHVFDIVENMLLERGVLETEESIENMLLDSGVIDPTSVAQMNENISRSTRTGGFIVDPKTGRMYHDNDPKAQKWKK